MSDLTLTPDDEAGAPPRQLRLVATGLADTAAVPRSNTPGPPPCHVPCAACGVSVLMGRTRAGTSLSPDTSIPTYLVDWDHGAPTPRLVESRGYPVHQCPLLAGPQCEGIVAKVACPKRF